MRRCKWKRAVCSSRLCVRRRAGRFERLRSRSACFACMDAMGIAALYASCALPLDLHDGQIAHRRHARFARRVIRPQGVPLLQAPDTVHIHAVPRSKRGALRGRHERWVRDAVDAAAAQDERRCGGRRSRVVLTPRRWCQVPGKQASWGRQWQESPVAGESTKETVKTTARGMPGVSGVTVVTNARVYYHTTRGCGRTRRPAFPAPSYREGHA
jgi:hypothetical protein